MEEKLKKLSDSIVSYSLNVQENDRVLITCHSDKTKPLILNLIDSIVEKKGIPFVRILDSDIETHLLEKTLDNKLKSLKSQADFDVTQYDCFIQIRYITNDYENRNVADAVKKKVKEAKRESDFVRINERRWVLLNYPSHLDAYKAGMSNQAYFDYAMDVMTVDYKKMMDDIRPLKELMERTKEVRLLSPGTDITFSIEGMPIVPCCGESNIPDGEIFTAPIRDSVNGKITYNTPSPYDSSVFHHVSLTFENGKIISCTSDEGSELLESIFDTDDGARYVGEFSLGLNPRILNPMGDILYDEKIIGSIHFTPGSAYQDAFNGNKSNIHWDLVLIQRKEYGGGELYFDHTLIRKDGLFVLPELQHLNYDLK